MLLLVIICGVLSIAYGAWAIRSVLAADAGNARMQEIAAAIQEGAGDGDGGVLAPEVGALSLIHI